MTTLKQSSEFSLPSMNLNILLADHHDLVRAGICELLSTQKGIKVVGQASSSEETVDLARKLNPDVILIELNMPGVGGLDTTQKILRINSEFKVIALTTYTDEPFPSRFIQLGGMGYLTKHAQLDELIKAIRSVDKGQHYIMPEIAQKMAMNQIAGKDKTPFMQLSERELQVMWMITQGARVNQIAEKLFLSPKTINTYRSRLFEKLGIRNDVDLTHLAIRYGILAQQDIAG